MCFTVDLKRSTLDQLADRYGLERVEAWIAAREGSQDTAISGFGFPTLPALYHEGATWVRWGLVPPWIRTPDQAASIRARTLNARVETLGELPSFRDSHAHRRCVICCTGYYEYRHEAGPRGVVKTPWLLLPEAPGPLYLAGLWSPWDGEATATIVTMAARGTSRWVHNSKERQPLILPPALLDPWIRGSPDEADQAAEEARGPRRPSLVARRVEKATKAPEPDPTPRGQKKAPPGGSLQLDLF